MRKADNLTTILCRCHEIWKKLTSWNNLGHSRPVTGVIYLYYYYYYYYYYYIIIIIIIIYLLQLSCHSVAVVLTLVQTKQIRINVHKRNNTKPSTNNTKHSKYEGWNFNSGNYLFTTDTK